MATTLDSPRTPNADRIADILLVHGTGGRGEVYEKTLAFVRGRASKYLKPGISVHPCLWGDDYGAKLNLGGVSIPTGPEEGVRERPSEVPWGLLLSDPLLELRLMAQNPAKSPLAPGRTPGQRAADVLINFEPADRFNQLIAQMQLGNAWESMKPFRHPDSELGGLIRKANREPPEMAKPIARTMVAKLLSDTGEDGYPTFSSTTREAMVDELVQALGGVAMGLVTDWIFKPLIRLVKSQATSLALRKRLAVSDGIAPFAGDVVLYQARGEAICDFIQAQIAQAPMPVVLVAHRLGGVACVDLLVKHDPFRQGPRFGDRGFPSATPV